jgi:AraC-like DNA-binding protein
LSPRTLRACFVDHVGLAPSIVQRIRRLHRALLDGLSGTGARSGGVSAVRTMSAASVVSARPGGWASVAAAGAGYADQSHLIRDCRDLMGETPEAFRARAAFR